MAFVLLWRRSEEKVFTTDVSLGGMFLRTAIAPPAGSLISLVLPEKRPVEECITVTARVVRIVRRGDPFNPLGGIGIEVTRILSPRGSGPANELMKTMLGAMAPTVLKRMGPITLRLPDMHVLPGLHTESEEIEEFSFGDAPQENTRPVSVELAVFCRWRNMIIQSTLSRLGAEQAILTNMKVTPEIGDQVTVRLLSIGSSARFRGLEFKGLVDQIQEQDAQLFVSLALNPVGQQPEIGGLRAFLRRLDDSDGNGGSR